MRAQEASGSLPLGHEAATAASGTRIQRCTSSEDMQKASVAYANAVGILVIQGTSQDQFHTPAPGVIDAIAF
jgi:hypothetical protein